MAQVFDNRVQVPAYTDRWMRGDRYGELLSVNSKGVARVKMDISGKVCRFHFDDCTRVW
jgi:fructose 1,6-bisphosphatase